MCECESQLMAAMMKCFSFRKKQTAMIEYQGWAAGMIITHEKLLIHLHWMRTETTAKNLSPYLAEGENKSGIREAASHYIHFQ